MATSDETWDIWYPDAGSQGIPFARGKIAPAAVVLVHAMPKRVRVEIRDDAGNIVAKVDRLERAGDYTPITRITRAGTTFTRAEIWPTSDDLGLPVLLPGGEAGILTAWWNAPDHSSWRWSIELANAIDPRA